VVAQLALDTPYNRSYELVPAGEPRGSVLLMHGLTDSPYAMRGIAEVFQRQGYHVVALRLPGHGTVPSGLREVSWEDWYAAVAAAAKHAAARGGSGRPFYIGGFSTGAALATLYTVRSLDDSALPKPQGIYLVSPAIGISPSAALTNVISGLAFIPAFEKSRWLDVLPEYDPYKYNSFPVNAAKQINTPPRSAAVLRRCRASSCSSRSWTRRSRRAKSCAACSRACRAPITSSSFSTLTAWTPSKGSSLRGRSRISRRSAMRRISRFA
jgi:alpha-beta hydrolase superfamily lysophospholipase